MRASLLALASFAAPLSAQFAFSVLQDGVEIPAAARVQLGAAAPGDTLDSLFRVRNPGNATALLATLTVAGSAFSLADLPPLPATLLPGAYLDFTVRFQPPGAGAFSAILRAGSTSIFLQATGLSTLTLYAEQRGIRTLLTSSSLVDFGSVQRGLQAAVRFVIANQTPQPLAAPLALVGEPFRLPAGTPSFVALEPQTSADFDVLFAPTRNGPQPGAFLLGRRAIPLAGTGIDPPLPKPLIAFDWDGAAPASGLQPRLSLRFDPPAPASGIGNLRLEFRSAVPAARDDPAILFLSGATRTIDFSVIEGEPLAQFGPAVALSFQTGTTAGTIVFLVGLGPWLETAAVEIPPRLPVIDSVAWDRAAGSIAVRIAGYDNTRSLSQAAFTFLKPDGAVLPPGVIRQDVSAAFREYFAASDLGGIFLLTATFPITGTAQIDKVTVALTNSLGETVWPQ